MKSSTITTIYRKAMISRSSSLVFYVGFMDHCLIFCPCSLGKCIVCPSIDGFILSLWYLQTFLAMYSIQMYTLLYFCVLIFIKNANFWTSRYLRPKRLTPVLAIFINIRTFGVLVLKRLLLFGFHIFRPWTYLMKVISETRFVHYVFITSKPTWNHQRSRQSIGKLWYLEVPLFHRFYVVCCRSFSVVSFSIYQFCLHPWYLRIWHNYFFSPIFLLLVSLHEIINDHDNLSESYDI
jgi:hypothetical protein